MQNTSGSLNRRSIADLLLLRTILAICQKSCEPSFWEVIDSFILLAFASLAASRTLLQWLPACPNFPLDSEDLFCWLKWKKKNDFYELWQLWNPQRWVRLDLILTMRDIYINSNLNPLTKFISSSRTTKLKNIFPWSISEMIMETVLIIMRIVISYTMKQGIPFWVWWKVKWSDFPNGGKAFIEQILASEDRNKFKRAGLCESQLGIQVRKLTNWVRSSEIEKS